MAKTAHTFTPNRFSWIVDSGASKHMTRYRESMINYEEFDLPIEITLGNGEPTKA